MTLVSNKPTTMSPDMTKLLMSITPPVGSTADKTMTGVKVNHLLLSKPGGRGQREVENGAVDQWLARGDITVGSEEDDEQTSSDSVIDSRILGLSLGLVIMLLLVVIVILIMFLWRNKGAR